MVRLVVTTLAVLAFVGCGSASDGTPSDSAPSEVPSDAQTQSSEVPSDAQTQSSEVPSDAQAQPSEFPSDALGQMEIAFEGNPSQEEIKADLDKALILYELPITEENYSRAGSVLVTLRKEFGVSEMRMLQYALRFDAPGVNLKLREVFAFAAVELATD